MHDIYSYQPPTLAITSLYWKAWTILLVISAFNPSTFGKYCFMCHLIVDSCLMFHLTLEILCLCLAVFSYLKAFIASSVMYEKKIVKLHENMCLKMRRAFGKYSIFA